MPSYSGVWNLNAQLQAIKAQNWPMGPGAPTSVTATAGGNQATISFTAPTFTGVPPGITGYRAISSPGGFTATGASSPLTVTGLTNGTAYTFNVDATNGVQYGPAGTSNSVTPVAPNVMVGGSYSTTGGFNISSLGNGSSFSALTVQRYDLGAFSSSTRGIFAGGDTGAITGTNIIDYASFSSFGSFSDFGDATNLSGGTAGLSNETRGCFNIGFSSGSITNIINYVTIASVGNATDFGDLATSRYAAGSCASTTRGIWAGGNDSSYSPLNVIEYITIASTGNATDFGDLTLSRSYVTGLSNATRGCFSGEYPSSSNVIDYITIASTGNAVDFGDLTVGSWGMGGAASSTRGCFIGGAGPRNNIYYITIASTGNSSNFGDLATPMGRIAACSSVHGGL